MYSFPSQFQALRAMVRANPQILQVLHLPRFTLSLNKNINYVLHFIQGSFSLILFQPMLQELGKQNPQLIRLIQDHQPDFLRLINEPLEGEG